MKEPLLDSLNASQKEAATTIDKHVRIVAGAGSGKTRVLMARIEYLINEVGVYPSRIMAITFTNKAANEMKERLKNQIGEDEASRVRISTIHGLALRIIREDYQAAGLPKDFTILDADDQKAILKKIYKDHGIDKTMISPSRALSQISDYKLEHVSPEQAEDLAYGDVQENLALIYREYEKECRKMNALDFDDLLHTANRLLQKNQEVKEKWRNRIDYLHVDEFQDVDPVQYQIVRDLTREDARVCVVGDPDQTIYTWRGAKIDLILHFDQDFKPCHTVILNQNYRSARPILEASNAIIHNNKNRIEKDLFTEIESDDLVELHEASDDEQEAAYVARQINELHKKGMRYSDMAILYRSNFCSRPFERVLTTVGIPYRVFGGIRYYDRAEIKDILSYLKLLSKPDPEDPKQMSLNLAVLRVINQPRRGIGARTIDKLQQEAEQRDVNLLEVMKDPQTLSPAAARKARAFYETIEDLRKEKENLSLPDLIPVILDYTGYEDMLLDAKEDDRLDNIKELSMDLTYAMNRDPQMTLESYLQDISLYSGANADSDSKEGVSLMTAHSSKGTEYPAVFITQFDEGIFPTSRAIESHSTASMEEERRLMYVGMTRAKERLFISWNRGYSYNTDGRKTPSSFLLEIPDELTHQSLLEENEQTGRTERKNTTTLRKSSTMSHRKNVRTVKYRKGDAVEHTVYGEGVVVSIAGDVASVAFPHPIGVKKLNTSHPYLSKKKA